MHFLNNDPQHQAFVETVFVYHDLGMWTDKELAYLEPSEALALKDNEEKNLGYDPDYLQAAIHWHHKITAYKGKNADVINAIRKADWIDATQGKMRKGLSVEQIKAVEEAIPLNGFHDVLQRLANDLSNGSPVKGNLRVLRHVFKW